MTQTGSIQQLEPVFPLLLSSVVGLAASGKRWEISYPIVLIVAGLVLRFIPRGPKIELAPHVASLVILPLRCKGQR
jgi:hypothetical protein